MAQTRYATKWAYLFWLFGPLFIPCEIKKNMIRPLLDLSALSQVKFRTRVLSLSGRLQLILWDKTGKTTIRWAVLPSLPLLPDQSDACAE